MSGGPLPHPDIIAGYENVLPGAADRIMRMAEQEQVHRHGIDDHFLEVQSGLARVGQRCAVLIAITGLVVAGILGVANQPAAAAFIAGIDLLGLVGMFIIDVASGRQPKAPAQPTESPPSPAPKTPRSQRRANTRRR
jgi:uncharacterized membrane protein